MEELQELRLYLRLDDENNDGEIETLLNTAKNYIETATGKKYDGNNKLMRLCAKILTAHWYENRGVEGQRGQEYSFSATALLTQIQQNPDFADVEGDSV